MEPVTHRCRLAYFCSCRELVAELVGHEVTDPLTGENYGYRKGNLESLVELLQEEDNMFSQHFNLVLVFHDDSRYQYEAAWQHGNLWPVDMKVPHRENGRIAYKSLEQLTRSIASQPWKDLRRQASLGETAVEFALRKAAAKTHYETQVVRLCKAHNVELIISDSYTSIFGPKLLNAYKKRILNIHPAITDPEDEMRLPGLTPTRDAFTRAEHGFVIVDDKHDAHHIPNGVRRKARFNGQVRDVVHVPQVRRTGVTVHEVNEVVDGGAVVLARSYEIPRGTTQEGIRALNYRHKLDLLPKALLQYVDSSIMSIK